MGNAEYLSHIFQGEGLTAGRSARAGHGQWPVGSRRGGADACYVEDFEDDAGGCGRDVAFVGDGHRIALEKGDSTLCQGGSSRKKGCQKRTKEDEEKRKISHDRKIFFKDKIARKRIFLRCLKGDRRMGNFLTLLEKK